MINLDFTDEQLAVIELARGIGESVLAPAARASEAAGSTPTEVAGIMHGTGLTAPVDERFGGGGIPAALTQLLAVEGFGYGDPGLAMAAVWAGASALLIGLVGTPQQQKDWLSGQATSPGRGGAVALYEGFGRSPAEYETTIASEGDSWRISGTKVAVANAVAADPLIVVGRDAGGKLRAAIVGSDDEGVHVAPVSRQLALGAARLGTVTFDTTITEDRLLGGGTADSDALASGVSRIRLFVAAAVLGTARRAVDYASKYATERVAFGKPIAAFQGVSFLMAEALTRIEAARLETFDAAAQLDGGVVDHFGVTRAVNYATAVATQSTRDAVQVLGGHGFITDHPVELWYRSAEALAVLDNDPLCSPFAATL